MPRRSWPEWVAARSWTSGDGPKAIFLDAVRWLRERKVLLPGVTTLARLVARVRDDTTHRLWRVLEALLRRPSGGRWTGCWRSRRGAGLGPGAVAQGAAAAGQRPGDDQGAGPGGGDPGAGARRAAAPRRWCRRGGWASWPGTG